MVAVLTLILNPLLIYSLFKTKQTHTNTFRFIIAMSISDVLLGAIVMPASAITISIRENHKNCFLDQATQFGFYLFAYFSFFMLMSITFDRLYQLRNLRRTAKILSFKQTACLFVICVVATSLWAYLGVVLVSFVYQIYLVVVNACLFLTMVVSCTLLIREVRIHNLKVSPGLAKSTFRGRVSPRINTNASTIVGILLVTLIVNNAPFHIIIPWLSYVKFKKSETPSRELSIATMWAYIFVFAYAFTNTLIFLSSNYRIKRFLRRRFFKTLTRKQSTVYVAQCELRNIGNRKQEPANNFIATQN